jgi:hypothetical protein
VGVLGRNESKQYIWIGAEGMQLAIDNMRVSLLLTSLQVTDNSTFCYFSSVSCLIQTGFTLIPRRMNQQMTNPVLKVKVNYCSLLRDQYTCQYKMAHGCIFG